MARPTRSVALALAMATTFAAAPVVHAATARPAPAAQPAVAAAAAPIPVQMRVDTNRDGVLTAADQTGDRTWSPTRGAVFLPNLDDDAKRCPKVGNLDKFTREKDAEYLRCYDAADTILNGREDLKDMAPVRVMGIKGLSAKATGKVTINLAARSKARLFIPDPKAKGGWRALKATDTFTSAQLTRGLWLRLEGRDIIRDPAVWNGQVTLTIKVTDGTRTGTDKVVLRVAPMLAHTHAQKVQKVLVAPVTDAPYRLFAWRLDGLLKANGVDPAIRLGQGWDPWAQDWVEPMYATMPAPKGTVQQMRLLLRSQQGRPAAAQLFDLRGPGTGVVDMLSKKSYGTRSSFGNLETIPAHSYGGKTYSAGRMIYGVDPASPTDSQQMSPEMLTMFRGQGMQDPLALDTGWLIVGHVDEYIQFLPANTPRGWRVAVQDPALGLQLLRKAEADGHGAVVLQNPPKGYKGTGMTISQALADKRLVSDNEIAARRIEAALDVVQRETGVTDAEVIRVPGLFEGFNEEGMLDVMPPTKSNLGRALQGLTPAQKTKALSKAKSWNVSDERKKASASGAIDPKDVPSTPLVALIPGAVNSIVMNKNTVIAAKQFGPRINGRDLFADEVRKAYAKGGMKVAWLDDFVTYHAGQGEVHCATNTLRDMPRWW